MAGKKKSRKSRTSKGIHGTTRVHRETTPLANIERLIRQLDAAAKGKNTRISLAGAKGIDARELFKPSKREEKKIAGFNVVND